MDSLLFYNETVCAHNRNSTLSKNTILFSKRRRHDDRSHFPCCNINTSPYATGGSTKKFSSVAQSCLTLCDPMDCSTPGFPVHHQLPEPAQTHVHCISDAIQPSHSVIPFSFRLQTFPASGSFQMSQFFESTYWSFSFSFSISPSNEHSGLISFRVDWLDLLAVQGTLKSLLQHHSSKASVLQRSAFIIVQLSHPYMTTGKHHSFD